MDGLRKLMNCFELRCVDVKLFSLEIYQSSVEIRFQNSSVKQIAEVFRHLETKSFAKGVSAEKVILNVVMSRIQAALVCTILSKMNTKSNWVHREYSLARGKLC